MKDSLDQALQLYRIGHPERPYGKVTIDDLLEFLIDRVLKLQEQVKTLRQTTRSKSSKTARAKKSEESIRRTFAWCGMQGPTTTTPTKTQKTEQSEGVKGGSDECKRD